ncbi:MAG: ATP-binding protein [Deltaproteobacteria bacterium]|nr:ATP-binding protein [Deltaproteobacteria bacterium]
MYEAEKNRICHRERHEKCISHNKLCSLIPFSEVEAYQVELCVVEAVNNCIEHAYGSQRGHQVEVVFALENDKLVVDVCDTGKSMDEKAIEKADVAQLNIDPDNFHTMAEQGRGLPIMKQIMDTITYNTNDDGKNCLTLIKNI